MEQINSNQQKPETRATTERPANDWLFFFLNQLVQIFKDDNIQEVSSLSLEDLNAYDENQILISKLSGVNTLTNQKMMQKVFELINSRYDSNELFNNIKEEINEKNLEKIKPMIPEILELIKKVLNKALVFASKETNKIAFDYLIQILIFLTNLYNYINNVEPQVNNQETILLNSLSAYQLSIMHFLDFMFISKNGLKFGDNIDIDTEITTDVQQSDLIVTIKFIKNSRENNKNQEKTVEDLITLNIPPEPKPNSYIDTLDPLLGPTGVIACNINQNPKAWEKIA
ncbi:MAG: hypothetical protein KatS3mg085_168 [Candidatus Dojkabacteria bacterium]|nr:MAG: hypothetical protein KatS3mg085_168 [Candidatus Dojkabacteria bacterium]